MDLVTELDYSCHLPVSALSTRCHRASMLSLALLLAVPKGRLQLCQSNTTMLTVRAATRRESTGIQALQHVSPALAVSSRRESEDRARRKQHLAAGAGTGALEGALWAGACMAQLLAGVAPTGQGLAAGLLALPVLLGTGQAAALASTSAGVVACCHASLRAGLMDAESVGSAQHLQGAVSMGGHEVGAAEGGQ